MPQIKKSYQEVTVPLQKMSFTPDVPATALTANEYNDGLNVEADVRGIRSVSGDEIILDTIPGDTAPVFITGGFRRGGEFWIVVATAYNATTTGKWYASNGSTTWYDITPTDLVNTNYVVNSNITDCWNGTVLILNDGLNPPFFWPDEDPDIAPTQKMVKYSNQVPLDIANIEPASLTTKKITFETAQASAPFTAGNKVVLNNVSPRYYNAAWEVTACTTTDVTITCDLTQAYNSGGQVAPLYAWNYNPDWESYTAQFMRMYSTPNVGTILVAGDLTAVPVADPTDTDEYPVTVQWSQAFGLNQVPTTWEPTVLNVANQLEVPLRGKALDAFPCNGQFFVCSYWDTVVFSPINYSTTSAPILGVRLHNQGRGLLSANCWGNTDKLVYGVDARDIWVFNGNDFQGLGNQRVKNWFYDQLDPAYYDRVHMQVNTQKNQIEIYYPDSLAIDGIPNKMLSYRYDLDVWNAPRSVAEAEFACESPVWSKTRTYFRLSGTNLVGSGTGARFDVNIANTTYVSAQPSSGFKGTGYAVNDTIKIAGTSLGGATPANDLTLTVTAIGTGGSITTVTTAGTALGIWTPDLSTRTILYVRGLSGPSYGNVVIQKDHGYSFIGDANITSYFRRDNVRLVKDYSTKVMVHRILPETINLDAKGIPLYPSPGSVDITIEGANSVGSLPSAVTPVTVQVDANGSTNADNPWAQINQNAYRVTSVEIGDSSNTDTWMCNAITYQFTESEDDR